MTSGRETLASIERAIRDLEQREADMQRALGDANERKAELVRSRITTIRELAETRLREALADDVIEEADHLSFQVATLLKARQETVDTLETKLATLLEQREAALRSDSDTADRIAALEQRLDELALEARKNLEGDAAFQEQSAATEALRETVRRADEKAEQAKSDRKSKGAPYESDPIFMYLWKRSYGRKGYDPHPVIGWLDEKCARLIDYHDARANYAVLLEIPVRLGEHVERLRDKLVLEEAKTDALLTKETARLAGTDLVAELKEARERKRDNTARLAELATGISETEALLTRYAGGRDEMFRRALETTSGFLSDADLSDLQAVARNTTTPTDDQLVARLVRIDREKGKLDEETRSLHKDLDRMIEKKEELLRLATEFRRADYDDPGSVFTPDGFGQQLLEELLRGAITGAGYWSRARRGQRWRSRPADPFRRGSGLPPFNGTIFGGRGGRSGRGGSSGGFRTGGGF